ncbi:uncharacterized protein LOC126602135 [Malus sylvestris]|uniref:uncharacterized protein LOC126602135 n=1 Tax=Malus sylvestris TaxID=3752 RepID=UPI0021ACE55F|nr:uncharacterized protein LOC126602135 [Malus sylvestris]
MADSGEGYGKKKLVVRSERYQRKQVPYFEGKNMAEAYAEVRYDIGNLVRMDCSVEFESWKKVPEELKKSMIGELSVHWDVDNRCEAMDLCGWAFQAEFPAVEV